MNIDYPYHVGPSGGTATTDDADHVRDMIEQLLFTSPGERVHRPDFGSGLLQAVFSPNAPELATALEYTTRAALQRHLSEVLEVDGLEIRAEDATLRVNVRYRLRSTGEPQSETFTRSAES